MQYNPKDVSLVFDAGVCVIIDPLLNKATLAESPKRKQGAFCNSRRFPLVTS